WPSEGEPVRADPQPGEQFQVLGPAVVVVACDVAGLAFGDLSRRVAEGVPDGRSAPVLVYGAFDLIGRGRGPPDEVRRKALHDACGEVVHDLQTVVPRVHMIDTRRLYPRHRPGTRTPYICAYDNADSGQRHCHGGRGKLQHHDCWHACRGPRSTATTVPGLRRGARGDASLARARAGRRRV